MSNSNLPANPFEKILDPEKEAEQIKEIADLTEKLLDKRYPSPKRILRAVHPKSHGCVRAVFQVNADIAKHLQVGLFATPGKRYDAWIRYSNARLGPDVRKNADGSLAHGSRGMAVKVTNVGGRILLDDHGENNQDFLMITEPSFAFANVADYQRLTKVINDNNDDPKLFFKPPLDATPEDLQRIKRTGQLVEKIQATPVANPLEVQYFGAAPFLFGPDRVMKFSAKPSAGLKPQRLPDENPSENYLREALIKTMSGDEDICFDFMVQVRGKEDGLNKEDIENASTVWPETGEKGETKFPFVKVAKITIPAPQNDINSQSGVEHCENLVFTPWHSLADHQPLGSINRLRKAVYVASETHRGAKVVPPPQAAKQPPRNWFKRLFSLP
ncbi:MAG: catalase family protein [Chromatiales bacterium]